MTTMYDMFATDTAQERHGIWIDYGQFRVLLARAGGQNTQYLKTLEAKTKPYRRAIATETMDNKLAEKILRDVYVSTVILSWESKGDVEDEEWTKGLHDADGEIVPFNADNVTAALDALPDLFADLQLQASTASLYRQSELEDASKN